MQSKHIWYELLTSSIDDAATFYQTVIGWTIGGSAYPTMDYRMIVKENVNVGGLMTLPAGAAASGMSPTWLGYIYVEDVDIAAAAIEQSGGKIHMAPQTMENVGRMAMVTDPQGAPFYIMTPSGTGESTVFASKEGHCNWNELRTSDVKAATQFYEKHFNWKVTETMDMGDMGTYYMYNYGEGDSVTGMMELPIEKPNWLFVFGVADIDATAERIKDGGGAVLNGPHQVPGGGWVVYANDPQGASFAVIGTRSDVKGPYSS
jgi:uncharacterized protein